MQYKYQTIDGIRIFYRECGSNEKPTMVLFHGFPSASHMFRDLMPMLEDKFHLIAPDYPGFGQSDSPDREEFTYSFDHLAEVMDGFLHALHVETFYMYVFDYGAPIGFRIAMQRPDAILGIVSQNGNVYKEGLGQKWEARAKFYVQIPAQLRGNMHLISTRWSIISSKEYTVQFRDKNPGCHFIQNRHFRSTLGAMEVR